MGFFQLNFLSLSYIAASIITRPLYHYNFVKIKTSNPSLNSKRQQDETLVYEHAKFNRDNQCDLERKQKLFSGLRVDLYRILYMQNRGVLRDNGVIFRSNFRILRFWGQFFFRFSKGDGGNLNTL